MNARALKRKLNLNMYKHQQLFLLYLQGTKIVVLKLLRSILRPFFLYFAHIVFLNTSKMCVSVTVIISLFHI